MDAAQWHGTFNVFQFHKGTIKTFQTLNINGRIRSSNSIKVRLRHYGSAIVNQTEYGFNSIKVRLRPLIVKNCGVDL